MLEEDPDTWCHEGVGGWVRVGLSWGWVGVRFSMNGIKGFWFLLRFRILRIRG